ncbi:asparaginase domain-containing protein [Halothiobacillus sp.]|uniref:asparaginase domain-containing protein n=1 Tax=Halothiobacillus sp. TaxID=1891311 RepID=UPI002AD33179|nr:asparaginase domain-containing protein [Halothiobacillus sp.]
MLEPNTHSKQPVVIINTGGTLNKRYEPIAGTLIVPSDELAITESLLSAAPNLDIHLMGLIHKDSLEMTDDDRQLIIAAIRTLPGSMQGAPIIVVHGTDTLHQTAITLDHAELDRVVILTGSMRPAAIDPRESALHLGLALGFIAAIPKADIYVAMHGRVAPYRQLRKNYEQGIFRPENAPD